MTPYLATSYVSRVCNVPPLVAQAALQEVARTAPMRSGLQWQLRLRTPKGPRVPALLVAGWGQRASVMIEIEPWSDTRVMIGLRHSARATPWWSDGYFKAAHAAVLDLATLIEQWADTPLRDLTEPDVAHTEHACEPGVDPFGVCRE